MTVIIGWDIGGVHLKAARADDGRVVDVVQLSAPLKQGLEPLTQAFARVLQRMGPADRHIVTMTGELADTFSSRAEGVAQISALARSALADQPITLYAGRAGFLPLEEAPNHVMDIASANWHATAALVARRHKAALVIDVGSTTTDLVPIADGAIAARGYTDGERLAAGELVYTGLVRSFIMATAERAPFAGRWMTLVNENFATMADVHRILGRLPYGVDQMPTADGRDKTVAGSRARLARMVGRDVADGDDAAWTALARWFAEAQLRSITDAAMLVLSRGSLPAASPVVGAGVGEHLARDVANRLPRDHVPFASVLDISPQLRSATSQCAPAIALAVLAGDAPENQGTAPASG